MPEVWRATEAGVVHTPEPSGEVITPGARVKEASKGLRILDIVFFLLLIANLVVEFI